MPWILTLVFPLAALFAVRRYVLTVTVTGQSLAPLLEDGDRVLAVRPPLAGRPEVGDLFVVWPFDGDGPSRSYHRYFVKQVVAVEGARFTTRLEELEECERQGQAPFHDAAGRREWHVPAGHVFLRGTGRLGGNDSLTWGPLPSSALVAKVIRRLPPRAAGRSPRLEEAGETR